jgi:hypothetical protein
VERLGPRPPLIIGPSVTAAGFMILGFSGESASYWSGFLPGLIVVAIGMTISIAPLTTTVFDSAPEEKGGTASGINNAAARTGGLLAVAALGLAFGASRAGGVESNAVATAYAIVMFAAAALAGFSALTAAMTIGRRVAH